MKVSKWYNEHKGHKGTYASLGLPKVCERQDYCPFMPFKPFKPFKLFKPFTPMSPFNERCASVR